MYNTMKKYDEHEVYAYLRQCEKLKCEYVPASAETLGRLAALISQYVGEMKELMYQQIGSSGSFEMCDIYPALESLQNGQSSPLRLIGKPVDDAMQGLDPTSLDIFSSDEEVKLQLALCIEGLRKMIIELPLALVEQRCIKSQDNAVSSDVIPTHFRRQGSLGVEQPAQSRIEKIGVFLVKYWVKFCNFWRYGTYRIHL